MAPWIVIPYDGGDLARATLRRSAAVVRGQPSGAGGVLLVAPAGGAGADSLLAQAARGIAGPDVPLTLAMLACDDDAAALQRQIAALPGAVLATSAGAAAPSAWSAHVRNLLVNAHLPQVVFLIGARELRQVDSAQRPQPARGPAAVLAHVLARLRPRRAPPAGRTAGQALAPRSPARWCRPRPGLRSARHLAARRGRWRPVTRASVCRALGGADDRSIRA